MPKFIENKKAVVNVNNTDEKCFLWAIISALFPVSSRVSDTSSYSIYMDSVNTAGMSFPVTLKDICLFEKQNPRISVNVFGLEENFDEKKGLIYEIVGPLRHTPKRRELHINLLYISDGDGNGHYCWIKNLSKLVSSQISKYAHAKFICDGCLLYFSKEIHLKLHQMKDCNHVYTITPTIKEKIDKFGNSVPGNILKFENFEKQMKVPFIVYADFETVLKSIDTCDPDPSRSFTNKTYVHEPYSFAYLIKCSFDDSKSKFVSYRGKDAAKEFVCRLETDLKDIYDRHLAKSIPMLPMSKEEILEYDNATLCAICEKPFTENDIKVRDHCHLTGKKRFGAAHSKCNLNYKVPTFIPIMFHNLSGYDCHLFIKQLCSQDDKIDVIAQNKEKYISFTKHKFVGYTTDIQGRVQKKFLQMRFLDSFRFLSASLQNLADSLTSQDFFETRKHYNGSTFELMRQKGVFPYSFVDNVSKLDVTTLPSKADFYDKLNEEDISVDEYDRAVLVWNTFKCQTLGDYSDIYLKTDVLLLADVFENFREKCLNVYKLDPAHYYTSPGLSWDAMLKYTKVELELLTDFDMIKFFKNGIRGGISQCTERKHIANNKYLPNYNPDEMPSFISYLDATNLYGFSMSQMLPTGGFEWLSESDISDFKVENISKESDVGYVLEVDVCYPQHLHDLHKDLPFLVESVIPPNTKSKMTKLIPNLNDKKKYIVHYKNLQQALKYGLKITKIHRILKFNQSYWLKKYIDLNAELRRNAKTKFEKDLFKLMVNAVYGKTMENVDNRKLIKLVTHWNSIRRSQGARALIAQPNFKTLSIFHENFVAIHMGNVKISYNKPIYVGFAVLELSKVVMYDFFYGTIKHEFQDHASLLYMDTDSLILKIETDDFYSFMKDNIEKFDTSNYKTDNSFNIPVTKSVLGKMKDEFPADPIISFYGTGAKAYYIQSVNSQFKKAKGIKRNVIKKYLDKADYQRMVEEGGGIILRKMNTFKSTIHNMYTEVKNKIALSHHDDKRFIIPNSTKTLPWGHSDIEFYNTDPEINVQLCLNSINNINADEGFEEKEIDNFRNNLSQGENNNLDLLINLLLKEIES